MDPYTLGIALKELISKHGVLPAIGLLILVAFAGGIAWLSKQALAIFNQWSSTRDDERRRLFEEVTNKNNQMQVLLTNHVAHLASSQDSFVAFQNATVKIQEGILRALDDMRLDIKAGNGDMYQNMQELTKQYHQIRLDIVERDKT